MNKDKISIGYIYDRLEDLITARKEHTVTKSFLTTLAEELAYFEKEYIPKLWIELKGSYDVDLSDCMSAKEWEKLLADKSQRIRDIIKWVENEEIDLSEYQRAKEIGLV